MDMALQMSTGLSEVDRKLVTYWTIATHLLPNIDTFPLLVLRGPLQTGKSQTLRIISCFAHKPRQFTVGSSSFAAIRDEFASCYEGTAIIEEADQAKDGNLQLERFLSDRYQRGSSQVTIKEKLGKDSWASVSKRLYGATALHRRVSFSDAALEGRSISILFRNVKRNDYVDSSKIDWTQDGYTASTDLVLHPVDVHHPDNITDRIFTTYTPLLMVAKIFGDEWFPVAIHEKMEIDTGALYEAQSFEPDGLVVRAIVAITELRKYDNIKLGAIGDWIWSNHGISLKPRQIGGLARAVGFSTKESHGVTVLEVTSGKLLKACFDCGYSNEEEMNELKRQVLGPQRGGWWTTMVDEVG